MTNEELAEKIISTYVPILKTKEFTVDITIREHLKAAIIATLDEAVSDALKDREVLYEKDLKMQIEHAVREAVMFERTNAGMTINWEDGFNKGFASAREMAAGIAEDHAKIKGPHIHEGFKFCVEEVASQIRTLHPTSEEGK